METSESLEGIFPGDPINGLLIFKADTVHYKWDINAF